MPDDIAAVDGCTRCNPAAALVDVCPNWDMLEFAAGKAPLSRCTAAAEANVGAP
jgi:hypothetical protein